MLGQLLILPNNVTFSTPVVRCPGWGFLFHRTAIFYSPISNLRHENEAGDEFWANVLVCTIWTGKIKTPPNVSFPNYLHRPQTPETPWNSKMAASLINSERHKICIIYKPPCLICVSLNQNCPASMCWCVALVFICAKYHIMHCLPAC